MRDFKEAELEIITFEEDVVVASGDCSGHNCSKYYCMGDVCKCDGQQVCMKVG